MASAFGETTVFLLLLVRGEDCLQEVRREIPEDDEQSGESEEGDARLLRVTRRFSGNSPANHRRTY